MVEISYILRDPKGTVRSALRTNRSAMYKSKETSSLNMLINGRFITAMLMIFLPTLSYASPLRDVKNTCAQVCQYKDLSEKADCARRNLYNVPLSEGCENSITLSLQENHIEHLSCANLQGYIHLETLDVSANGLCDIHPGSLNNTPNLQKLFLNDNNLTTLLSDTFTGAANLKRIHFMRSNIVTIEEGAFNGLSQLVEMYASDNKLQILQPTVFHGLSKLQSLYLNNNKLKYLSNHTFGGLINLNVLSLLGNKLSYLPQGLFKGLNSLQQLHLSYNELFELPPPQMLGISSINLLHLDHNNFRTSASLVPYWNITGKELYINGNPFTCDSSFKKIQELSLNNTPDDFLHHTVTCTCGNESYDLKHLLPDNCTDHSTTLKDSSMTTEIISSSHNKSLLSTRIPTTDKNDHEMVSKNTGWKIATILSVTVSIILLLCVIVLTYFLWAKSIKPNQLHEQNQEIELPHLNN